MGKGPLCPGQHQSSAGTATARLPGDEPRGQLSPGHRSMATRRTAQLPGVLPASRSLLNPGHLLHGALAGQGGRLFSGPASCLLGMARSQQEAQGSGAGRVGSAPHPPHFLVDHFLINVCEWLRGAGHSLSVPRVGGGLRECTRDFRHMRRKSGGVRDKHRFMEHLS